MEKAHNPEHVFREKERIGKLSQIRELVFGAQDGLLVPLGVVTSIAGAFNNNHIVLVAGISEALAGAFSMGTGAYLASQAEKQVHDGEIAKEKRAIKKYPKEEGEEMTMLFEREGVSAEDAQKLSEILSKHQNSFSTTMIQKELGLDPEPAGTAMRDALYIGLSYLFAAFIPLAPYFFATGITAIVLSIGSTLVALFVIGFVKGKLAMLPYMKSGFQVMLIGGASGVGGYLIGTLLPKFLHLE